jgi:hypothetical protein
MVVRRRSRCQPERTIMQVTATAQRSPMAWVGLLLFNIAALAGTIALDLATART